MILIRDIKLCTHLLNDAQLGAGEHTFGHQLANRIGVDTQADFLFLFLVLDDVEGFAQVLGRLLVFPRPAGNEALGELLLHRLIFAAWEATD